MALNSRVQRILDVFVTEENGVRAIHVDGNSLKDPVLNSYQFLLFISFNQMLEMPCERVDVSYQRYF